MQYKLSIILYLNNYWFYYYPIEVIISCYVIDLDFMDEMKVLLFIQPITKGRHHSITKTDLKYIADKYFFNSIYIMRIQNLLALL